MLRTITIACSKIFVRFPLIICTHTSELDHKLASFIHWPNSLCRPPEDLWSFFDSFSASQVAAMAPCMYHYVSYTYTLPYIYLCIVYCHIHIYIAQVAAMAPSIYHYSSYTFIYISRIQIHIHIFIHIYLTIPIHIRHNCGASSQPDLIQNHLLIARMLRFLRHSRQKVPYLNIPRQKVTYFNVF